MAHTTYMRKADYTANIPFCKEKSTPVRKSRIDIFLHMLYYFIISYYWYLTMYIIMYMIGAIDADKI